VSRAPARVPFLVPGLRPGTHVQDDFHQRQHDRQRDFRLLHFEHLGFTISGDTLKTAAVFDAATRSTYSIRVRITDPNGVSVEQPLTIQVTPNKGTEEEEDETSSDESAGAVAESAGEVDETSSDESAGEVDVPEMENTSEVLE
jgi:hypothetical protein